MKIKNKGDLITKSEYSSRLLEFRNKISTIPDISPLVYSVSEVRRSVLDYDSLIRDIMLEFGTTPKLKYVIYNEGKRFLVTVHRVSLTKDRIYEDFTFRFAINSVLDLSKLKDFIDGIFLRLLEEYYVVSNLTYFNSLIEESLELNDFNIWFTPDIFNSMYVKFISNDSLILTADSTCLYKLVDTLSISSEERVKLGEFNSLSICHSTVEALSRKSPIISCLLNSGKLGLKRLLRPVYNKTTKQLSSYQKAEGYGYLLDGNYYGVIHRDEYGLSVVLDVYNLETFEKESDIDLFKEVEQ